MIFPILLIIISFFLDGILSNFLPFMMGELSYFTPFLTLICIILVYPLFKKKERHYMLAIMLTGLLYDLFYTNLFLTHCLLFGFFGLLVILLYRKVAINWLTNLCLLVFFLFFYQGCFSLLLFVFNIVPITLDGFLYQFSHSLVLNVLYGEVLYFIIKSIPRKNRLN